MLLLSPVHAPTAARSAPPRCGSVRRTARRSATPGAAWHELRPPYDSLSAYPCYTARQQNTRPSDQAGDGLLHIRLCAPTVAPSALGRKVISGA